MPRRAVYRGLVGGYEQLREEPAAVSGSDVDFICLTDDPTLTSTTWRIVVQAPRLHGDSTRSVRFLKMLGHPCLDDYDETLWVDNTVELKQPPDELFDTWLDDADIAAPLHSYRTSILAEAEAVIDAGLDDFARVYEQMSTYLSAYPGVGEENPHWTGILARRRGEATTAAMQTWWEHVLRYSRRDQLSFLPTVRASGLRLRSVPLDNRESPWHAWPRANGRDLGRQVSPLRAAIRPAAGRIGQLEQALDQVTSNLTAAVDLREELITRHTVANASKDEVISQLTEERDDLHLQLRSAEARSRALRQRVERKSERLRSLRMKLEQWESASRAPSRPPRDGWALTRVARKALPDRWRG